MNGPLLADLLEFTRDGEWGKGEPAEGHVMMGIIRGTDFDKVRYGDFSTVPVRYIPKKSAERKVLRPGDILFETAGGTKDQPTGRSVFLKAELFENYPYPLTCASFSRFLRVAPDTLSPKYLFWYLQYLWTQRLIYNYHIQHTGVARFQYTQFASEQRIPLPDRRNQEAIAATLGALDDKIELNRRMAGTLEEMARALYRSWIVDFDPVRARAAGLAPAHMDPATAALFPDRFGPDGLPEGWAENTLADLANLDPEKWSAKKRPETLRYVDLSGVKWGVIGEVADYAWSEAPSRARKVLRPGDTIVGTVRPGNGSFAFVSEDGMTGSTGFAHLRPKQPEDRSLLYLAATAPENIEALALRCRRSGLSGSATVRCFR